MRKRGASKLLLSVLVLALVLAAPLQAFAAEKSHYVSLGDSIAVGLSAAPGHSYYDLYSAHLGSSWDSVNLAAEGKTSTDLLNDLKTDSATRNAVAGAKTITISIGANNLLGPVLGAVYAAAGINPAGMTTPQLEQAVADFINGLTPAQWAAVVAGITAQAQTGQLNLALQGGVRQFLIDWPQIVRAVKMLAPSARVYVLTIYNPLRGDPTLGRMFGTLTLQMNTAIRLSALQTRGVMVVGTDVLFALNPGALSFNLATLPATTASVDPHPTTFGHLLIYRTIVLQDLLFRR